MLLRNLNQVEDSDAGCNNAGPKQRGKYWAYSIKEKEAVAQEAKERGIQATTRDRSIAVSTIYHIT